MRAGQARRLCLNIDRIRSTYEKLLKSADDLRVQQLATAIWIIDRYVVCGCGGRKRDAAVCDGGAFGQLGTPCWQ
jgi:hypothetical protein